MPARALMLIFRSEGSLLSNGNPYSNNGDKFVTYGTQFGHKISDVLVTLFLPRSSGNSARPLLPG